MVLSWRDKKVVTLVSTEHDATMTKVASKRGQETEKPECVVQYNKFMKGVDQLDQNVQYCQIERRLVKWTKNCYFGFFMWPSSMCVF